MSRRRPKLSPAVIATLEGYRPHNVKPEQREAVELVLPRSRDRVAAAVPRTPKVASTLMGAAVHFELWGLDELGTTDIEVLWHPHNANYYVTTVNKTRSAGWKHGKRSSLRRVGSEVNPGAWTQIPPPVGRSQPPEAYVWYQERGFIVEAQLPGRSNRAARLFTVGASCGAGMSGPEIRAACVENLDDLDDRRIGIRVAGRRFGVVPVRAAYTDVIREAAQEAGSGKFITGDGKNAVYTVAQRITDNGLSLRRARRTWLLANLVAGVGIPALRAMAGPVSMNTLDSLLPAACAQLTPEQAIEQGLRA